MKPAEQIKFEELIKNIEQRIILLEGKVEWLHQNIENLRFKG